MKKLQNNFTTPEQSKQLLEIGLPADSADCFLSLDSHVYVLSVDPFSVYYAQLVDPIIPCWSVGRLIEIFLLCSPYKSIEINKSDKVEQMIVSMGNERILLDFSKLED